MRISLNWLQEYVPLVAPEDLRHRLTMAGFEVEAVERRDAGLEHVVVGQILESSAHPGADKLSVTRVTAGGETLQIVCGAKNYKVGDKVPVALVGAHLPNGMEIKKANLRGVESSGMLCSAKELGLEDDKSGGLLILDAAASVGTPIAAVLGRKDIVFEVNVTPNRPDALSHIGLAREVVAITGAPLHRPPALLEVDSGLMAPAIQVTQAGRCPRYMARVLEGVKIGPSPRWMQSRLEAVGVRPINNVVDITNYVLMELGQPLHAFDLDHLAGGRIEVRSARAGEKLKTLDGKDRELSVDDLVIADAEKAVALAGVMGGSTSEVSDGTHRLLLESAYFEPTGVRRTARAHGLHTEASHRFERGVDIEGVPLALDRAASLIAELAGGRVSAAVDVYPSPAKRPSVELHLSRISQVLGTAVDPAESEKILSSLGFELGQRGENSVRVTPPSFRVDVSAEEDLIEEVARIRGYDAIPSRAPRVTNTNPAPSPSRAVDIRARAALSAMGLDEVVNYSFVSKSELEAIDPQHRLGKPIELRNPISAEMSVMRTSLLPGLFQNLQKSLRHQSEEVRLYELGRVYLPTDSSSSTPALEQARLAGLLFGPRTAVSWSSGKERVDFYDAKGVVEQVLDSVRIARADFTPEKSVSWLHPLAGARVHIGSTDLGYLGEIHPVVAKKLQLPQGVFAFDLSLSAIEQAAALLPSYQGIPRFPAVLRDLAVVVDETITAEALERAAKAAGGELVEDITLFDVYQGPPLADGKKNLAFAIRYRAPDRTLTDAEAIEAHNRILAALAKELGAQLRS
jgi:phenylalanyl-tRNA synthetase beta chain